MKTAHFVTFFSPGTFVHETTTRPIDSWDIETAKVMADSIVERYGATPFGFQFTTRSRGDEDLDSKISATSPMYFLGGTVEALAEVKARATDNDRILISNMEGNGWDRVVTNTNCGSASSRFDIRTSYWITRHRSGSKPHEPHLHRRHRPQRRSASRGHPRGIGRLGAVVAGRVSGLEVVVSIHAGDIQLKAAWRERFHALPVEAQRALKAALLDLRTDALARAALSWKRHKAPMALYWKVVGVYAGHLARAIQ